MKKFLMFFLISAFVTTTAVAQDQAPAQDKTEWNNKVKTELNLTAEQVPQYDALIAEYDGKISELMNDTTLTGDAQKEQKMALKEEKKTKLMAILTPEQQTKYQELMDKKKEDETPKAGF